MNLTPQQIKMVKSQGFLNSKDGTFAVRVITVNGVLTAKQMANLVEVAEKFGNGKISFTSRLTVEIPGIKFQDIPAVKAHVAKEGMSTGGTGAKVRPVVSCKGTVCQYGNIDTQGLAAKIHEEFYKGWREVVLPHKFKIGVGGCPNNCVKPELNDLGVVGVKVPQFNAEKCRGCAKCAIVEGCPMGAASIKDGKIQIDSNVCNHCGRCHKKCPFDVFETATAGYKVCIGGRWGKKTAQGKPLSKIFTSEEEVLEVIDKAICLFRDEGLKGERFADTINRLGFDYVEGKLIG